MEVARAIKEAASATPLAFSPGTIPEELLQVDATVDMDKLRVITIRRRTLRA
jgi:hypothetical protein